jgi:hypothetical protein
MYPTGTVISPSVQHVVTHAHSNLYLFISQPSLMAHKRSDSDEILLWDIISKQKL